MSATVEFLRKTWRRHRRPLYELFGSDRWSHLALNDLDRKLKKYLDFENGTFIEAGGNDGLSQSNTYWFERFRGWRGLLVEPVPDQAALCRRNRPHAEVINAALVADASTPSVRIKAAKLMAFIPGARSKAEEEAHLDAAIKVQQLADVSEIEVPAVTLASILDAHPGRKVDFLSLDVEGYEIPVLLGMAPERHRPGLILVETPNLAGVLDALKGHYQPIDQLSHHDYLLKANR
ncbi:MAG TPA: FkbM family methyltransferase [Rhizomicrobium sp.]|nr:FkbM family methyltransferase [Rhizomicrobium sp.]